MIIAETILRDRGERIRKRDVVTGYVKGLILGR